MFDPKSNEYNVPSPGLPRPACLVDATVDNYRTRTLAFDLPLQGQPGQFLMVWIPGLNEKPFSIAGVNPLRITVARVGPFSGALHGLRIGDRVGIRGPLGLGFELRGERPLLVGGGYGVAPLAYLAERLTEAGTRVTVVIGARTAADLLLVERFRRLGAELYLTTDDGSAGIRGQVTDAAEPLMQSGAVDVLYGCGSHCMLEALEGASAAAGVPAQLSWEARMKCGIGICGSCEHKGLVLCKDGPVVPAGGGVEDKRGRQVEATQVRGLGEGNKTGEPRSTRSSVRA